MELKGLSRLFYADETILTDIAHVGIWDHRPQELPNWSVSSATEWPDGPIGLFDRTRMEKIAPLASNSVLPGGYASRVRYTPYAVQRRLAHACVDAWLSQSDPSWSYSEAPDRLDALSVPAAMVSISWTLAGSVRESRLEALASLDPQLGGKPNPLSFMFDEENDGISRGSSSFFTMGFGVSTRPVAASSMFARVSAFACWSVSTRRKRASSRPREVVGFGASNTKTANFPTRSSCSPKSWQREAAYSSPGWWTTSGRRPSGSKRADATRHPLVSGSA